MSKLHFTEGNDVELLHSGAQFFPALISSIDQAQHEVYLESYIFATDQTAQMVQAALVQAAARGVKVRVVIDWIGSDRQAALSLTQCFNELGVDCRCFNPWFKRGLARTHRKICVVDRQIAIVGGLNIIDDNIADDGSGLVLPFPRWDFAVTVTGPLVASIHLEVDAQWRKLGKLDLRTRFALMQHLRADAKVAGKQITSAALVVRDNLRNRATIQRAYLHALGMARSRAVLVTPYFAPGRKFRRALISAATRGVDVVLLLGVGQFALQDAVSQSFYPKLLAAGVRIVEYGKTQLHAKVAVIDEDWATVGSSNFDGLSLFVNHEANIVVRDKTFAASLAHELELGIADGTEIFADDVQKKAWYKRAWHGTAYLIYRGLMRIVTFGHYG
ncbi:MAG: phospholipase D-like domain-containing protein [Undibacterium umbellatum]|uniref:phospholipase D-like domain-containing protein n=1 Tax=Undibacterium umbellatum TaxID=2762300 RepID=UPI003BB4B8D6